MVPWKLPAHVNILEVWVSRFFFFRLYCRDRQDGATTAAYYYNISISYSGPYDFNEGRSAATNVGAMQAMVASTSHQLHHNIRSANAISTTKQVRASTSTAGMTP